MKAHSPWLLPLAGVAAAVLVHNVALSSYHCLATFLKSEKSTPIVPTEAMILCIGLIAAAASYAAAVTLRQALKDRTLLPKTNSARTFLDTALVAQAPGAVQYWLFALLGLAAILFLSALHAVAHVLWHWLEDGLHMPHVAIISLATAAALAIAARVRHRSKSTNTQGDPGQNDALILFLSEHKATSAPFAQLLAPTPMPWSELHIRATLDSHFWAMPARTVSDIWRNGHLRHIVVICSTTSRPQMEEFKEGLRQGMAANPALIHPWPLEGAIDFFNFDQVNAAVKSAYTFLENKGLTRIAIDLTSGTKICSIVGLLESLEPGRGALYVNKDLLVRSYDIQHDSNAWAPLPHEGI